MKSEEEKFLAFLVRVKQEVDQWPSWKKKNAEYLFEEESLTSNSESEILSVKGVPPSDMLTSKIVQSV